MTAPSPSHPVRYWRALGNGRIQCDLCPRYCKLREGQRGLCFVRACENSRMVLTTYGRSSGFCIDPIEKKPLFHFLPGTPVLSFGTAGCNLTCKFCQNWDISRSRQFDTLADLASPQAIASAARQTGCTSVAFTYNDPVIFHEYAIDVAQACHEQGIKAIAVSAGYICPEPRAEFYRYMDAVNIDLKAFSDSFYYKLASAHLERVKETLAYIRHETDTWLEITTLIIPGENDSETELYKLCEWVREALGADVPLHFSAFSPAWKMQDKPRTPPTSLYRARRIALDSGLHHAYTGNITDQGRESTYCHGCGQRIIGRDWHLLNSWALTGDGHCRNCGEQASGVFDGPPGEWGRKRQPVDIARFAKTVNAS